jgi:uncharacterized protein (TIGR02268 family)
VFIIPKALLLVLLSSPPEVPECERVEVRFELSPEPTGALPVPCVSPGQPTLVYLDSALASVNLPDSARFELPDDATKPGLALNLMPRAAFTPGERVPVLLTFKDGAVPESVTLWVAFHPAVATRQVRITRASRSAAEYRREAREARAEVERLREEIRQLRAERPDAPAIINAIDTGVIGTEGVQVRSLTDVVTSDSVAPISVWQAAHFQTPELHVLRLSVGNEGERDWGAVGGSFKGMRRAPEVWQRGPVAPGASEDVYVSIPASVIPLPGRYMLTLWSEDGRTVEVRDIPLP